MALSITLSIAMAMTALATVEAPARAEPLAYLPLNLRAAMNANPWDLEEMFIPELPFLDSQFTFLEGQAVFRAEGAEVVAMPTASEGAALHGLANEDEWAEWTFDAHFDTDDAILYARVARPVGEGEAAAGIDNPFTLLSTSLNQRPGGVLYAVAGGNPQDFSSGIVQANLGLLRMGRHVLRLTTRMAGEPVTIDCLWVAARGLDIRNELDEDGRILRPFAMSLLAYEPGRILAEQGVLAGQGIPFDLIDPRENGGRGILMVDENDAVLPMSGEVGHALLLLGAGSLLNGTGTLTIHYADGSEQTHTVGWPPLYSRTPAPAEEVTVPMGLHRRATVRRIPLDDKPLAAVHLRREGEGRLSILAATLSHGNTP